MAEPASPSARGRVRGELLEARITGEQKILIERVAAREGRTVTDFVLTSVQEAARRAIEEHQRLDLSLRESEAFVDALLDLPTVGYRQATGVQGVVVPGRDAEV